MTRVRPDRVIPAELAEHARAFARGGIEAVTPRFAATVVLLRDAPDTRGVEAYVMRRVATMEFASGMTVFPGGTVDPRDADARLGWVGPEPRDWGDRLDVDESLARELVCAAVRETFEESGVLLAGPTPDAVVADTSADDWERDRRALVTHERGFADVLTERGLLLRSDLLRAWARWVTPEFEPRRYDTFFFVAALPDGQRTREVGGEADRVEWAQPARALDALEVGAVRMLPPTAVVLGALAAYESVADVLSAAGEQDLTAITPRPVIEGDPVVMVLPGEPGYDR